MEMKEIRLEQLLMAMPNAGKRAEKFLPYLNRYAEEFEINTPLRWAHYLAQIAHESGELRYTKEIASGKAYEGRKDLGNTHKGDGVRYKGRGLIQITGRANYRKYAGYCGYDVVEQPELLEKPLGATRSSMWIFDTFGCNELADEDNLKAIRRKINGGYKGLEKCEEYLKKSKRALNIS